MAVGTVSTRILTDIANAIRYQAGVATLYKPREMAAAVAALDGTDAGGYQAQPYMTLESGVLPESVFTDIADAIRGQNGLSTLYQPGDMAAAILALGWDVGYKIRGLLLDDGTFEINYYERRTSVTGGRIVQVFEIDPAGYSSASARSYDSIKLLVKKVYIDPTIAGLGLTNCNYWFNAFSNCTEVRGFENLSGMTSATQMFSSCTSLETIYATSFSNSGLSGSLMFTGCTRLVGGMDGFVPSQTSGASVCKLGAGGVLTDPNNDARTWFWAHYYADGERAHGDICAGRHARARRERAHLRHRQVRGPGLHALGRHDGPDAPPVPHERDVRGGHGLVLVPEPELPVLQLHEPGECQWPGQPLWRALDALHVQLLRVHDDRLPGLRPIHAHGPVLHVLGVLAPDDDLRGRHLGAAHERHHGFSVLLQLRQPRRRQRHGLGEQQDGVHVLPHRHGEHAGVCHGGVKPSMRGDERIAPHACRLSGAKSEKQATEEQHCAGAHNQLEVGTMQLRRGIRHCLPNLL